MLCGQALTAAANPKKGARTPSPGCATGRGGASPSAAQRAGAEKNERRSVWNARPPPAFGGVTEMPPGGTSGVTFAAPSPAPAQCLIMSGRRMSISTLAGKRLLALQTIAAACQQRPCSALVSCRTHATYACSVRARASAPPHSR